MARTLLSFALAALFLWASQCALGCSLAAAPAPAADESVPPCHRHSAPKPADAPGAMVLCQKPVLTGEVERAAVDVALLPEPVPVPPAPSVPGSEPEFACSSPHAGPVLVPLRI
jgi:hypothetical protein